MELNSEQLKALQPLFDLLMAGSEIVGDGKDYDHQQFLIDIAKTPEYAAYHKAYPGAPFTLNEFHMMKRRNDNGND